MRALGSRKVGSDSTAARKRGGIAGVFRGPGALWAGICAAGLAAQAALVLWNPARYQWDFRPLYLAPLAWRAGFDPYSPAALQKAASGLHFSTAIPPFLYPPPTLLLFTPLSILPFRPAYDIHLTLSAAAVAGLFLVAHELLSREARFAAFPLFALFGFQLALGFSVRSGNVAIFETFFLLLGILCFSRRRWRLFAACIVLAGMFKLVPLVFLALLLIPRERGAAQALGVAAAAVAIVASATALAAPALTRGFLSTLPRFDSYRGPIDSSLLALVKDLQSLSGGAPDGLTVFLYAVPAAICLALGIRTAGRIRKLATADAPIHMLMLAVLTYGVIAPRMLTYYYPLLLVPVWFLTEDGGWAGWALRIAAMIPTMYLARLLGRGVQPAIGRPLWLVIDYWSWLVLAVVWLSANVHPARWTRHDRPARA